MSSHEENRSANGDHTEPEEDVHEAGILGTAVTMSCNIMGGAVLVLPTAMDDASLVPGLLLVVFLGVMSCTTMIMLAHTAEKLRVYNYRALLSATTHPLCGRIFEMALFLYTYGVLIEYGRVISDSIPDAARDFFHVHTGVLIHGWFWLLIACIPFIVFTAMPRLTELKWTSIIGFITIAYIQLLIVARYADGSYRDGRESYNAPDVRVTGLSMNFFRAIPVLAVAFSCHYNVPFYYRELKTRTIAQFYRVLLVVHPALVTAYFVTGLLGYLTFGSSGLANSTGNVVNAFRTDDTAANVGRIGLFFHFCTAFPIVALGNRNCLNSIIFGTPTRSQLTYIVESIILVSTSAALAWVVPGIAFVVDIIGSLFGVAIVFIVPSVVYVMSNRRFPDSSQAAVFLEDGSETTTQRFFAAGGSSRAFESTNADDKSNKKLSSPSIPLVPQQAHYTPPATWTVRRNSALYVAAHAYIVLGIAGAIISFAVTIDKVSKGES